MASSTAEASTLGSAIRAATGRLAELDAPRHDAERLIAHALGISWSDLWTRTDQTVPREIAAAIDEVVARRAAGEPLAYILGSTVFYGLEIACGPGALVPRPETETLVDVALTLARGIDRPVIVDVGCGTGAIAIAIGMHVPEAEIWATDISDEAIAIARTNLDAHGLDVSLAQGDLFDALPDELRGRIDLVVSNPPYIPAGTPLPADVGAEPSIALFAGSDGTEILRRLTDEAPSWVRAGGAIACEIGDAAQASVFGDGEVVSDHTGRPRVVWIRR